MCVVGAEVSFIRGVMFTWWVQKSHLSGVSCSLGGCRSLIYQGCHVHLVGAEVSFIRGVVFTWWVQKSHLSGVSCSLGGCRSLIYQGCHVHLAHSSEFAWFSLQKIVILVCDTWPVANSKIVIVVIQMTFK